MTNEEAIMYLQDIKKGKYQQYPLEQNEALDLAINALERIDKIYPLLDPDIDQEIALDKIREVTYE